MTVPPVHLDLVTALLRKTRRTGHSVRSVSRELGLNHTVLTRVAAGQARLGLKACVSIAAVYPALRPSAAAYLAERYAPEELSLLAEAHRIRQDRRLTR